MAIEAPAAGGGLGDDEAVLALAGDLEAQDGADLAEELGRLARFGTRRVVLDLRDVDAISAPVVGEILRARRDHGIEIACTEPSPAVRAVLAGTGAALVLGINPT